MRHFFPALPRVDFSIYVLFIGIIFVQRESKRNLGFKIGTPTDHVVFPKHF